MGGRLLIMSFKPLFAQKIIDGVMDCEVRSFLGRIQEGDIVLVYASAPVKAVVGFFRVGWVYTGYYSVITDIVYRKCRSFDEDNWVYVRRRYSCSKRKLVVFQVNDPVRIREPIGLNHLKNLGLSAPRSYIVVKDRVRKSIEKYLRTQTLILG